MKNKEKYDLKELKIKWLDHESMEIYADDGVYRMNSNSNAVLLRGLINWLEQEYQEPPILDDEEREYLSAVIKPWRDKVTHIKKTREWKIGKKNAEFIRIRLDDVGIVTDLPYFKAGTMYKGMELDREYTLEELKI